MFYLLCALNCCIEYRLTKAQSFTHLAPMRSVLTGAYVYSTGNYTEVTGASIITPIIQKSLQQNLTHKLQHPLKLPHLALHPRGSPCITRGFW